MMIIIIDFARHFLVKQNNGYTDDEDNFDGDISDHLERFIHFNPRAGKYFWFFPVNGKFPLFSTDHGQLFPVNGKKNARFSRELGIFRFFFRQTGFFVVFFPAGR